MYTYVRSFYMPVHSDMHTGIARNSWGPSFADKGYFRIKYGVCGVAGPDDTYG